MITKECFGCGNVTAHQHLHDCAHGIAETHIVGSERFVCELCGHVTRAGSLGAERFPFTFDKEKSQPEPVTGAHTGRFHKIRSAEETIFDPASKPGSTLHRSNAAIFAKP